MADQTMTAASQLSAIVPEKWSRNFYDTLLENLPFASIISREWEGEIQDLGDTVNISEFPQFDDADLLDEDGKNDAEAITVSGLPLVINKRAVKDFIVTRRAVLQSLPHMDRLQDLAIFSLEKKIQREIIDLIVPSASAPDHQIAYDAGSTLALADLLEGKELLDTANVAQENRHAVMDSPQMNDIFNITGFTSSDFLLSGSPIQTGQLPSALLGFMPHMTTEVSGVTYLFHESFMTLAVQEGMSVREYDLGLEGKRATRVNVDTLFGVKQLGDDRVVSIS